MSELNRFKEQTVVGIVTCNRQDMFEKCLASIDRQAVDRIIVVVSGDDYTSYPTDVEVFKCKRSPTPVGSAKNILIREMRKNPAHQYHFIVEDDVAITDNRVFEKYILTALDSGLGFGQLSFATHGSVSGGNITPSGTKRIIKTVQYDKHRVELYEFSFAAFTLYFAETWKHVSGFDEEYVNAGEHLHLHRLIYNKKFGLPPKTYADIEDSHLYLADIDANHERSAIRNRPDFRDNFLKAWDTYKKHWGVMPHEEPLPNEERLMNILEELEERFAIKKAL
jgi:hypothetical protein